MFGNSEILNGFIVFEGLDGSGTTTQLKALIARLQSRGVPFSSGYEPTDGPVGQLVRKALADGSLMQRETLARLFAADRSEHLYGKGGVLENLRMGKLVISDRYFFSSLAYQGRELGLDTVWQINSPFPLPEILIYFDIPPEDGARRYAHREHLEIYEKKDIQEEVRLYYERIFTLLDGTGCQFYRIDSTQSIPRIEEQLWSIVGKHPIVKE